MSKVTYTIRKKSWLKKPYSWVGVADNNEVVCKSSSNYFNKVDAEKTIQLIQNSDVTPIKYVVEELPKNKLPKGSLVLLLFMFLSQSLLGQKVYTYLYAADRADYKLYEEFCNDSITVDIYQYGKVVLRDPKVPGLDWEMLKMMPGDLIPYMVRTDPTSTPGMIPSNSLVVDTLWYIPWKPGAKATSRSYGSTDIEIKRIISTKVPRRKASINDYYHNWKTGKLKEANDYRLLSKLTP